MTSNGICQSLTVTPLAESALLVRLDEGEEIDPIVVDTVTALTHAIEQAEVAGIVDLVPAYCTILIEFDPAETDGETIEAAVRRIASEGVSGPEKDVRVVIIPVAYGGEHGPDLQEMAGEIGLPPDELVRLHAGADYRVACMGFSPGWAYLMGLPPELTIPRRKVPRTRIPAGSVAVGGAQTGVYPLETPGGWHLIGRTPLSMFDPDRAEPFLLRPGDHVRFVPIDDDRFVIMKRDLDGARE
jgi:KipI family sensor histidine kinase inhibitor